MTNEEKAEEIAKMSNTQEVLDIAIADFPFLEAALSEDLMHMAAWKDEQFAKEKAALIDRIVEEFEFQNFTFIDYDGNLDFDCDKFRLFLEKVFQL